MKKIVLSAIALAIAAISASADEGMWLLPRLQKMNEKHMIQLGCKLSADQIYNANNPSLKDAIVQFGGGCTGEMISSEGLLVTNHHCGYSSIQGLSTPEHNYLEDGYWAMSRAEELPVPGLTVTFMQSMTEVTGRIAKAKDAEVEMKTIEDEAEKKNPGCSAVIEDFFNENVYYLIIYKTYRDVRFVGAPPASSGKFGGDTDNWMWPRHTCDFSMFRVYADKDNQPAEYSADNVPMKPAKNLKISLKGINDGDFAMVMGYPGSTERYMTTDELEQMLTVNAMGVKVRGVRQEIMWAAMEKDPAVRLQYSNKYASSSNYWKNWIGMQQACDRLGILDRKAAEQADFTKWVESNKKRTEKYGTVLNDIAGIAKGETPAMVENRLLNESLGRIELASMANNANRMLISLQKSGKSEAESIAGACGFLEKQYKDYYEPLDREITVAMIKFYRENAAAEYQIPELEEALKSESVEDYVDNLFASSIYSSEDKALKAIAEKGATAITGDPALAFFRAIRNVAMNVYNGIRASREDLAKASKTYTAGLMEWKKNEELYPDANFTMRLTYGTVKSYEPKDGVLYKYYTTLDGVMEKEDESNYEFRVPAKLKEVWQNKDFGDYAMKENGKVPACFLTTNDITGGNSGSPVMDAEGNLIGLAFDGNWESMSGDIIFEPELQRCICVDIRYVLLLMDKVGGAGYLLKEMDIVK